MISTNHDGLRDTLHDFVPFLPFVIITVSDGYHVLVGRKTFEMAVTEELLKRAQPYGIFDHEAVRIRYEYEPELTQATEP